MRPLIALAFLVCATVADVAAQPAGLEPGARVRVSRPVAEPGAEVRGSNRWETGVVTASDTATVSIRLDSGILSSYPYEVIDRAEVSRGMQSSATGARNGLIRGAGVGGGIAVTMVLIAKAAGDPQGAVRGSFFVREATPVIVVSTLAGAALGYAIGSHARERWEAVSLPDRRVSVHAAPGGTGIGVSVRF